MLADVEVSHSDGDGVADGGASVDPDRVHAIPLTRRGVHTPSTIITDGDITRLARGNTSGKCNSVTRPAGRSRECERASERPGAF